MKKLIFTLLLLPLLAIAQVPKPEPNTYVNDLSGSLSATQIADLNTHIRAIETAQNVQIAVVLVQALPTDMVIEDYAREIGRTWHVGNNRRGLVYVAAISQHKQRLEVGTGLEGDITDIQAKELTDNIKAFFRSQHYYEGINTMLKSIDMMVKPEIKAEYHVREADDTALWLLSFAVILLISFMIYILYTMVTKHRRKVLEQAANDETASYDPYDQYLKRSNTNNPGYTRWAESIQAKQGKPGTNPARPGHGRTEETTTVIAPIIINEEPSRSYSNDSSSSSSSSSSASSSDSGNWGNSDSTSSSSSDSFSGGGSSNDW